MKVNPFHSANEIKKLPQNRVFHDNNKCGPGSEIPPKLRLPGRSNYNLCEDCARLRK